MEFPLNISVVDAQGFSRMEVNAETSDALSECFASFQIFP